MTDETTNQTAGETLDAPSPDDMLAKLESEKAELNDRVLRLLAELDNTRKRAEREKAEARIYGIEKFAADLLAVSDNLSRALSSLPESEAASLTEAGRNLIDGISMTEKQLAATLQRHGVTPVDAAPGSAFDANCHQAVTQIPSSHPAGTIAECFQPGWKIGDRTLRAAMVAVSAGAAS
jgi:molecular chaperone GrpE